MEINRQFIEKKKLIVPKYVKNNNHIIKDNYTKRNSD